MGPGMDPGAFDMVRSAVVLGRQSTGETAGLAHHATEQSETPLSVLVAEDNPINQKVISHVLKSLAYQVHIACNGQEALNAMEEASYDVVFMNCQMPILDGFEATRAIRRTESSTEHIPIIALTANALVGDDEKCFAAGMDAFLSKPVKKSEIIATMDRFGLGVSKPTFVSIR